MYRQVWVRP
ncbi:hypothetical protein E2C01_090497 [Portunus trituberculatus]|uniref:Uncharacterized protein n=1 Tax=Portunus trituberculatus TaxID=210409 RepID=A0A5B7JSL0_PORTR|nr:hypothetical protein [Portunus trituberculatus]